MSFSFVATVMLVSSSAVIAFVLQTPTEELRAPASAPVSRHRCQQESLHSIRKSLLSELNLQVEPQLPAGGLDLLRKEWRRTFENSAGKADDPAVPAVADSPASREGRNDTSPKCCPVASEVFMTELGWDSWVIHPPSLTVVTCALCDPQGNIVQCPPPQPSPQDASQPSCCQPRATKMVPVIYVDAYGALTMDSVQLPSRCSCGSDGTEPSSRA